MFQFYWVHLLLSSRGWRLLLTSVKISVGLKETEEKQQVTNWATKKTFLSTDYHITQQLPHYTLIWFDKTSKTQ